MKKTVLTFSLILFFFNSFCQNWSVINSIDRFNYRLDNDPVITSTIWSDSVTVNGTDSVFFLNRIMCDTCATVIGGPNPCDTCYAMKNIPQFFQRQTNVSSLGIVNFRDTGNIVINTLAALNDSWLFDSLQNITATVIAVATDSVFGNFDSVKTILLTSGDTIKLSQNFGVLQYPHHYGLNSYYRLAGIEGRGLGAQVPKFTDFFNFNVGDMFEFEISDYTWECHPQEEIFKYSIINKQVNGSQYEFTIQGIKLIHDWTIDNLNCIPHNYYWTSLYNNFIVTYYDSASHVTNRFNKEYFILNNQVPELDIPCYGNLDSINDHVRMFLDSNGVIQKSFGIAGLPGPYNWSYYFNLNYSNDILNPGGLGDAYQSYSMVYTFGLGVTAKTYSSCFEPWYEEHLTAYRKNGDTVGVFTSDSVLTVGLKEYNFISQIRISPNPASTSFSIYTSSEGEAQISITNLQGQILKTESIFSDHAEINVTDIENGLYFVRIKTADGIFSKMVMVLH
ncbi:MAG: T9SS type A sorting domain-containing protein [Bacteroidota bacterium]